MPRVSPGTARTVGVLVAVAFAALGLLHLLWAAGWRSGTVATIPSDGGKPLFQPSVFATLVVAALLFAAAAVVTGRIGLWGSALPRWPLAAGTWVLAAVFGARVVGDFRWVGLFKRASASDFAYWDTRLFVPLCALLAIGCAVVSMAATAAVD